MTVQLVFGRPTIYTIPLGSISDNTDNYNEELHLQVLEFMPGLSVLNCCHVPSTALIITKEAFDDVTETILTTLETDPKYGLISRTIHPTMGEQRKGTRVNQLPSLVKVLPPTAEKLVNPRWYSVTGCRKPPPKTSCFT